LYLEQINTIKNPPDNEMNLIHLKNTIAENKITLAKLGNEVDKVYDFLLILEDY